MHKLLILSAEADDYLRLIQAARLPDLECVATTAPEQAIDLGLDCDLALGEPPRLSRALPQLPRLRWVQATWAGVEPLLDPRLRRDYILTNARGIFGVLMSEYVFGYLLAYERHILQRYLAQQAGQWDETQPGTLRGKQIGLLGVGSIGTELARTARRFGMSVRGYTRASESCPDVDRYYHPPNKLTFASGLDYLVCVLPHLNDTRQIIDRALLATLPAHALLVNAGRGNALDETALVEALQSGRLAGAVLDVFNEEPLPPGHIFWRTPNLLVTSHTAAPTFPEDIIEVFLDNYRRLLRGEVLRYQVNFELGY
jgi:phosphoglycerate dehydrogenase-like enzyme